MATLQAWVNYNNDCMFLLRMRMNRLHSYNLHLMISGYVQNPYKQTHCQSNREQLDCNNQTANNKHTVVYYLQLCPSIQWLSHLVLLWIKVLRCSCGVPFYAVFIGTQFQKLLKVAWVLLLHVGSNLVPQVFFWIEVQTLWGTPWPRFPPPRSIPLQFKLCDYERSNPPVEIGSGCLELWISQAHKKISHRETGLRSSSQMWICMWTLFLTASVCAMFGVLVFCDYLYSAITKLHRSPWTKNV